MIPTAAQQIMIDDGLPAKFILSTAERHAIWEANPPRIVLAFFDARIEKDRQLREQQKKEKQVTRLAKMKAGLARKATTPFSTKGLRWDTNYSRWVPDNLTSTKAQEEDNMPKFTVTPYDPAGNAIKRAVTSIKTDASDEEIMAQILHAAKRGGTRVATVNVTAQDGSIIKTHACVKTDNSPAAPAPADAGLTPTDAEESEMAKKSKVKKVVKAKKAKGNGGLRAGSKQELLYDMLTRKSGCTSDEAVKATGWQTCSVSTWGKKFGLKVTKEKQNNGVTRYYGA